MSKFGERMALALAADLVFLTIADPPLWAFAVFAVLMGVWVGYVDDEK